MRFDELTLQDPEGELRVRFHPALTMLCGLEEAERRALSDGILGAVTGGPDSTRLHLTTADGSHLTVRCADGRLDAQLADGAPHPGPLAGVSADAVALRSLMLLNADDVGALTRVARENEPVELKEARAALETLSAELEAAIDDHKATEAIHGALAELEREIKAAHDGVARREYALVLARLERVRAEMAAIDAGEQSVESDRHLLASADAVRALVRSWTEAAAEVAALSEAVGPTEPIGEHERDALISIPAEAPADLASLVARLEQAESVSSTLDKRLQALSVAKLPAPSDPMVAELGLLDQEPLWEAAERAGEAIEATRLLQVSLGGLDVDGDGATAALLADIESAHVDLEAAEQAVAAARTPTIAAAGTGVALTAIGALGVLALIPLGAVIAVTTVVLGHLRPSRRLHAAAIREAAALERAGATSYLGFHIRRVEASVDPELRARLERSRAHQQAALTAWAEVAGSTDVGVALELRSEIEQYSTALRDLGDTAEEIEELRRELADKVTPALLAARGAVLAAVAPYGLDAAAMLDHADPIALVEGRCALGARARADALLIDAQVDLEKATARLEDGLLQLGFGEGPLDARAGALDWAITRASEREAAREAARPRAELDAEVADLEQAASSLRRPEWSTVTAAEASAPDIAELEAQREELRSKLLATRPHGDVERLADRRAAAERRVASLEAKLDGHDATGDPAAIAQIRQHLFAHLRTASTAGPAGDPVPVVLEDVLARVPADRTWDLLDQLLRAAEGHQLIYLSGDAFVAAWARKRALEGVVTLLELSAEPAA